MVNLLIDGLREEKLGTRVSGGLSQLEVLEGLNSILSLDFSSLLEKSGANLDLCYYDYLVIERDLGYVESFLGYLQVSFLFYSKIYFVLKVCMYFHLFFTLYSVLFDYSRDLMSITFFLSTAF